MRVRINLDVCDQHGQCIAAVPTVFEFGDDGLLRYRADIGDRLEGVRLDTSESLRADVDDGARLVRISSKDHERNEPGDGRRCRAAGCD